MQRILAFFLFGLIAIAGYSVLVRPAVPVSLVAAKAFAMPNRPEIFMVTLTIENAGAPDVLLAASSPKAEMVALVNPRQSGSRLVVPGQGRSSLAMDGAHVMLRAEEFAQGGFIPLTLTFEKAGEVSTRLQHAGMSEMSHDPSTGVVVQPVPLVNLHPVDAPDTDGFALRIEVENFSFYHAAEDETHLAGQGHAHLYLNGLKLGRLYDPSFSVGPIAPGRHVLEVALNTNDHRPYLDEENSPVLARMVLEVAE